MDNAYHQKVQDLIVKLPREQQALLNLNEQYWESSIRRVKQNTLDDAEQNAKQMNILWQAAVYRSQPIRYAIEKLSQQDASGKPVKNNTKTKQILNGVAQVGGAATSIVTGTPVGLISGTLVNDVIRQSNTSSVKPVSDADMVILARAVDTLQQELLTLYLNYTQALDVFRLQESKVKALNDAYTQVQNQVVNKASDQTNLEMMRFVLEEARLKKQEAEARFRQCEHDLGLKVGAEALALLNQSPT
jgi:outer membrane protein TolC